MRPPNIVIAHHLIFTAYGCWLPNDPRGSSSLSIRNDLLSELGELHHGRKHVQPARGELLEFRDRAEQFLQFDRLEFDEAARAELGGAFGETIGKRGYTCWACAVMPDHAHLLIRKHRDLAEDMIDHLRISGRDRLVELGHRDSDHPTWCDGSGWKVFVWSAEQVVRTIKYIEDNPIKIGLPSQRWEFVKPYTGWTFKS